MTRKRRLTEVTFQTGDNVTHAMALRKARLRGGERYLLCTDGQEVVADIRMIRPLRVLINR